VYRIAIRRVDESRQAALAEVCRSRLRLRGAVWGEMAEKKRGSDFRGFEGETSEFDAGFLRQFRLERNSAILQVLRGADTGMRIPLTKDSISIGRTVAADLVFPDDKISRLHARVERDVESGDWYLVDNNSTNGTFLNNRQVAREALSAGDKIFVGHTILKFLLEDEVESESAAMVDRFLFQDDLTGLVVKRRFYNELEIRLQMAISRGKPLAVLMMDMDGLKAVNDRHGHSMGAHVISEAGKRIGEICNPLGQACRYGGDEFVAYVTDADLSAALDMARQICAAIRDEPFHKDGHDLSLSISIGVASYPDAGATVDLLNRAADEALYRAKDKGRDTVSD